MAQPVEIEGVWREVTGAGHSQTPPPEIYSGGANLSVGQLREFIETSLGRRLPTGANIAAQLGVPLAPEKTTQDFISALVNPILKELGDFETRVKDFGLEGPFAFDEALAREASKEIVDPYYNQLLSEFTEGIQLRRRQGVEQERELLDNLSREREFETGTLRQRIEDVIETTEKGYETRGLYASGERRREVGRAEAAGITGERRLGEVFGERGRGIEMIGEQERERLGLETRIGERELVTGRREETEAGVEARRAEAKQQTEIERLQTTALPFVRRSEEALQRLLQFS